MISERGGGKENRVCGLLGLRRTKMGGKGGRNAAVVVNDSTRCNFHGKCARPVRNMLANISKSTIRDLDGI